MRDATSQGTPAPFPDALRVAISQRGVSLEWLRGKLTELGTPVSVATLSYWRSGRSQPEHQTSLDALGTLEELLYLPTGHLRSRLRPSRRPGPRRGSKSLGELMGGSESVRQALRALDYDPDDYESMVETSTQVTLDVDARGRGRSAVTRSVWKALRDGAQGQPFVFRMEEDSGSVPDFRAISGCSIGKSHVDLDTGTFATEVLLERPLTTGETAISEHEVVVPVDATPDTFFEIHLTRRVSQAMLWIRFDADRLPVHCQAYTEDARTRDSQVLSLRGSTSAHHVVRNVGPGKIGIHWRW